MSRFTQADEDDLAREIEQFLANKPKRFTEQTELETALTTDLWLSNWFASKSPLGRLMREQATLKAVNMTQGAGDE